MNTILIGNGPGAKKLEQKMANSFFNMFKIFKDIQDLVDLLFIIKELILSN